MRTAIYDSRKILEVSDFPNLKRSIGVQISHLAGEWLEVNYERVLINTASFGINANTREKALEYTIADTKTIVEHLDTVIAELIAHRERMTAELAKLLAIGIDFENKDE